MGSRLLGSGLLWFRRSCIGVSLIAMAACPNDEPVTETDTDDDSAPLCGNGVIEAGEQCDAQMILVTCAELGFSGGSLSCDESCQIVATACTACGDNVVNEGEACDDGNAESGDGCAACTIEPGWSCLGSSSVCTASCGNGVIDGSEECDDADSFDNDGCTASCTVEPGWACAGQPSVCTSQCGNGALEMGEECDGDNFDGATCEGFGYLGGNLICASNCTISQAACESCGNDLADPGEDCDGTDLDGRTCRVLNFESGTLVCADDCSFDTTGCRTCGNDVVEDPEECDNGVANSDTEPDACRSDCTNATCGDNVIDDGETCDPPLAESCDDNCAAIVECANCGDLLVGAGGPGCCGSTDLFTGLELCVCGGLGSDCAIACADTLCMGNDPTGDNCESCLTGDADCTAQYLTCVGDATLDIGPEDTPEACGDACNNDGDMQTDCDDADCFGIGVCAEAELNCNDGEDNDGDNATDCDDDDCLGAPVCD